MIDFSPPGPHTTRTDRRRRRTASVALVVTLAVLAAACSDDSGSGAPSGDSSTTTVDVDESVTKVVPEGVSTPDVSGPITEGSFAGPFNPMPLDIAEEYDYGEEEYFFEGDATAYVPDAELTGDGMWTVSESETAAFKTRILVRKPADPADFNGTVVIEWLNVSAGVDSDPDFGFMHPALMSEGFGYVGVSAQKAGVEGGGFEIDIPGYDTMPLTEWDPVRYGELHHPGDDWSYDIYTQAAAAALGGADLDPFDGYDVERLIAVGESQSALRMVSYVNGVHPLTGVFDGFLIHSRGAGGTPFMSEGGDEFESTEAVTIRTDLDVPVLQFQTETDIVGILDFLPARQPDTDLLRTWEVAGTAHADQSTLDYGIESGQVNDPGASVDFTSVCGQINTGPQRYVLRRAIIDLDRWIRDGTAPAEGEPITIEDGAVVRDEHGNALGGIRTPTVDVPIATQSGETAPDANLLCSLFGHRVDFDAETLTGLYPSHEDYVEQVTASAAAAVEAGFLLSESEAEIVSEAEGAAVP